MSHYVYSTATNSMFYVDYVPDTTKNSGYNTIRKKVLIKGGHGVASRFGNAGAIGNVYTPKGIVTEVSDEDMEFLLKDQNFQRHVKAGFMTYEKRQVSAEKMAENMAEKDGSAQITPQDFVDGEYSSESTATYKKDENVPMINESPIPRKKGKK